MAPRDVSARLSLKDRLKFSRELKTAGRDVDGFGRSAGRQARHMRGFARGIGGIGVAMGTMGVAVGVAGFALGTKFVNDARESAKIGAITGAVIKSTGGAANLTAKQVGGLATAISNKTGIDDEAIQANENVLLTFTKVRDELGKGNQVFSRATGLAQDMATVMGTDAKGASMQLGKALNDPVKGISALSRAGVSFTAKQKTQIAEMVKAGDTLGAQKMILHEVGKEFGGAAEAAANPMDKLKVTLGNVGEAIGAKLIPYVDRFSTWLIKKGLPAAKRFWNRLQDMWQTFKDIGGEQSLKDLLSAVGDLFKNLAPAVGDGTGAMDGFKSAIDATTGIIGFLAKHTTGLKVVVLALAIAFGGPVTVLGALALAFIWAWKKSETFRTIMINVAGVVLGAFEGLLWGVETFLRALGHIPGFGWATKAADKVHGLRDGIQGVIDKLKGLKDKKVKVTVQTILEGPPVAGLRYGLVPLKPATAGLPTPGSPEARARGGPVVAGMPYRVGEHGPELMVPNQSGRAEPHLRMPSVPSWSGGDARGGDGGIPVELHTTLLLDGQVVAQNTDRRVAHARARRR